MVNPFITMDVGRVMTGISTVKNAIDGSFKRIIKAAERGMTLLAEDVISQSQEKLEGQTRSGNLKRSATVGDLRAEGDTLILDFGFNSEYGAQVDRGGPILPKKGRMLAIPLEPILTGRGVPRYSSPREEPDLKLVVLFGKVFLVKKSTRKSGEQRFADFHWLLVPRVDQKGSAYFTGTVKANVGRTDEVVGGEIKKALESGGQSNG